MFSQAVYPNKTCQQFCISEKDLKNVKILGKAILPEISKIIDRFYDEWMVHKPYYKKYFFDDSIVLHLKEKQIEYWTAFFEVNITEEYIASRKRLGEIHAQIGLSLQKYHEALGALQHLFQEVFHQKGLCNPDLIWSFVRYLNWDISMVSETTADSANQMLERMLSAKANALDEMSTPIAQFWEGILLLPVVGQLSNERMKKMNHTILHKIHAEEAKVLVLDISGVTSVNKKVAKEFINIAESVRLMGCFCTISGISAKMAEILVELDVKMDIIDTSGSLVNALQKALRLTGKRITSH